MLCIENQGPGFYPEENTLYLERNSSYLQLFIFLTDFHYDIQGESTSGIRIQIF